MFLLVYVDDIIVLSSSATAIPQLIAQLGSSFSVKDLGVLHYFLGIEVSSPPSGKLVLVNASVLLSFWLVLLC
jgi:histone deacetylase 1/2